MASAAKEMEGANLDSSLILFSMWTEAVRNFMQALVRSVEGSVRAFVATKRQSEVLILRRDMLKQ